MLSCGLFKIFFQKKRPVSSTMTATPIHQATTLQEQTNTLPSSSPSPSYNGKHLRQEDSKYVYENGRRYHNQEGTAYVMPDDDAETDRIHQQHWILKAISDGNFTAPVEGDLQSGINVVDAGCGPGTWTLEMANAYPNSTFYGIDIVSKFPETIKPGNCHFQNQNLADKGIFPENYFGYIHQRLLFGGLLEKDWEKIIQEHARTLAPGGWLEAAELSLYKSIDQAGPKLRLLLRAFVAMSDSRGLHSKIVEEIEGMYARAGLVDVQVNILKFPLDQRTQLGKLGWDDFCEGFLTLKPLLVKAMPEIPDEGYEQFLDDIKHECKERASYLHIYRVLGRKPLLD
ncbi:S-adenosyl-L-methionine-dependent methyltransferase [Dichotomocladium elegans]|nr:S-adenosyl-L-methionine-dependent methyltransferase [Dichotomocladium elegans]